MRTRIIIDTQDAADAPDSPFTLNVYRDDDDGTQSRLSVTLGDGSECLIGSDIPAMLRALADEWEFSPLDAIDRDTLDDPAACTYCAYYGTPNIPATPEHVATHPINVDPEGAQE